MFKKLRHIDLSGHGIAKISPEIAKLEKLETLALRNNRLTSIPPGLGNHPNLGFLGLVRNRINQISSDEVEGLENACYLRTINLSYNPLSDDSQEILKSAVFFNLKI